MATRPHRLVLQVLMLAVSCLPGCVGAPPFDPVAMAQEWAAYMQRDYILSPGDTIVVNAYPEVQFVELTQEVRISPNGTVNLIRLPRDLRAAGLSVSGFTQQVQQAYAEIYPTTEISVSLIEAAVQSIFVVGEIGRSGPIPYEPGMTLSRALAAAGGFRITAKESDVRIIRNSGFGVPKTIRVNAENILYDEGTDFLVLPGDVIFCQTSGIADAGIWVQLWIRNLLPFNFPWFAVL